MFRYFCSHKFSHSVIHVETVPTAFIAAQVSCCFFSHLSTRSSSRCLLTEFTLHQYSIIAGAVHELQDNCSKANPIPHYYLAFRHGIKPLKLSKQAAVMLVKYAMIYNLYTV